MKSGRLWRLTGELEENSVCAKFAHTANDNKTYQTKFYNLDAIISVGYLVNSRHAPALYYKLLYEEKKSAP